MRTIPFEGELTEKQIERIKKWCDDLESGSYKQSKDQLVDIGSGECTYCCLGVASITNGAKRILRDLVYPTGEVEASRPPNPWMMENFGFLSDHIVGIAELDDCVVDHGYNLMTLNDSLDFTFSFNDIAKVIRSVFLDKVEIQINLAYDN